MMLGTRVAETILASGYVRPYTKAGHMSASDPIKSLLNNLARRVPSTYGVRRARRLNLFHNLAEFLPAVRDSQRDRLAHRPHGTIQASPFRVKNLFVVRVPLIGLGSRRQRGRLLSKAEFGCLGPHAG